jgi:hypothetical protein
VLDDPTGLRALVLALVLVFGLVASANAATWRLQSTPNPAGAIGSSLKGVACPTSEACVAVGQQEPVSGTISTLGEHFTAGTWRLDTTPNPGSGIDPLLAVSCSSTTACTAVGSTAARTGAIAERWNGTSWALQTTAEASTKNFEGVECYSAEGCIAVSGVGAGALSEIWNGREWRTLTVPNPPEPSGEGRETRADRLVSVACTSSTFCLAVGRMLVRFEEEIFRVRYPLAETWNGSEWRAQSMPATTEYDLQDVSCTSTTFCMTVGQNRGTSSLALSWNGTEWTTRETPTVGTRSILLSISCTSTTSCAAVGYALVSGAFQTLAMRWDGTSWSTEETPNPERGGILNEVSCLTSALCTAVGHYRESGGQLKTLAVRYE